MSERSRPSTAGGRDHALVIGGSMAGLLAARVLSNNFRRVTVVERDRLPEDAQNRKGVPQGRHAHALLPRGHMIMEGLFPGLSEELASQGATVVDGPAESRWHQPGGYRVRFETGRKGLFMSRPFLEAGVRRRVHELPNVAFLPGRDVTGLVSTGERVSGVRTRRRDESASTETLAADLVVDAGGRGSRAPAWLEEMGYERPEEERIEIGVVYTTRLYRRRSGDLPDAKFVIVQPTPGRDRRMGAMFPLEDERWMVTLGGWLGERAPADEEGFVAFARSLPAREIHTVVKSAEPLGEAVKHNFPSNLRRRYERLERVPDGYLVTGDALCSFNPIYGQGMSVAALEAETLEACLSEGTEDLPRRFYRSVSKVVDAPWKIAAGADFAHPGVNGKKAPMTGVVNWYLGHLQRAATRDEAVCRALVLVTGLLAPPESLFHPGVALRVLRHSLVRRRKNLPAPSPEVSATETA